MIPKTAQDSTNNLTQCIFHPDKCQSPRGTIIGKIHSLGNAENFFAFTAKAHMETIFSPHMDVQL